MCEKVYVFITRCVCDKRPLLEHLSLGLFKVSPISVLTSAYGSGHWSYSSLPTTLACLSITVCPKIKVTTLNQLLHAHNQALCLHTVRAKKKNSNKFVRPPFSDFAVESTNSYVLISHPQRLVFPVRMVM